MLECAENIVGFWYLVEGRGQLGKKDLHRRLAASISTKRVSRPSGPGIHSTLQHQTQAPTQAGSRTPCPPRPPGRAPPGRGGLSQTRSWPSSHVWYMKKPLLGNWGRKEEEGTRGVCENGERIGESGLWLFCGLAVVGSGDVARNDVHAPVYRGATLGYLSFLRVAGRREGS